MAPIFSSNYANSRQNYAEISYGTAYQQPSMEGKRLELPELEVEDQVNREIWEQGLKNGEQENVDRVMHHKGLPYMPLIIRTKLISSHHY